MIARPRRPRWIVLPAPRAGLSAALASILALAPVPPAFAGHAQVLTGEEVRRLEAVVGAAGRVRHFCAPCGDTLWREERVREARGARANPPADEWSLFLNGEPVDAAYLYLQRGDRWRNAAALAGLEFPDVPATLREALREADVETPDSAWALFSWSGRFECEDRVREGKARSPIALLYSLRILDSGDSLKASLSVDGPGVTHRMALRVSAGADSARMQLASYLKENYGKPYATGAWLFTLRRTPGGGLATDWGELRPRDDEAARKGFAHVDSDPRQPTE